MMALTECLLLTMSMFASPSVIACDGDDKTTLLNAESASVPREINIGFPDGGNGAIIYIDGTKHAQGILKGYWHWAGGNSYSKNGTINLVDAVIRTGEIAVVLDSGTRLGTDNISGVFTTGTSTNGLIKFDGNIGGPLSKGWYFSAGAFACYDPTDVNAPSRRFVDQRQIYQTSLSKRWKNASVDLIYRLSLCNDAGESGYNAAPFIYCGDGSIESYNGFKIGRSCYFPSDDYVEYVDVVSGERHLDNLGKMNRRVLHDVTLKGVWAHPSGWNLGANLHLCRLQPSTGVRSSIAGIDEVGASDGFSLSDGSVPFAGNVQNRQIHIDSYRTLDSELLLTAERSLKGHKFRFGSSIVYSNQYEAGSSLMIAHTVEDSPSRLLKNGQKSWNFNRSGQYYTARRYMAAFYAIHDWMLGNRLLVRTGVRLKPQFQDVMSAARLDGETKNARVEGFFVNSPELCELHNLKLKGLDWSVSEHIKLRTIDRLYLMAEGFYGLTEKTARYYRNASIPSTRPIGNAFARGGLMYDNSWMDATAVVSYITNWDAAQIMTVTKQVGGISETIPWTAQYGIGTFGVTGDMNFSFMGFNMHLLATWQNPKYRNYRNEFVFSDDSKTIIDYTDNCVTGISKVMLELNPSYRWQKVRAWASVRYFSRQYASRTNLAWFNGHWETFAGVDCDVLKSLKLSVNAVNFLFQNGSKGSMDIADTITDSSALKGYLMSGTYIRPFSVDFTLTYSF